MIKIYEELIQGSPEWLQARCGLLTASEMKLILSPETKKPANNDKVRAHVWELAAQRISGYVEPSYIGDDMMRGEVDEIYARDLYDKNCAPVRQVGFITNDKWGFTIGYSPDGLIGAPGLIEIKSRKQKYQVEAIVTDAVPEEFILQIQTGLLVSERKWVDFISYSGGLPLYIKRVLPDKKIQDAIISAAALFEKRVSDNMNTYKKLMSGRKKWIQTERQIETEEEFDDG